MIILNKDTFEKIWHNCDLFKNHKMDICNGSVGKVIIAPPASGKSFFVKNQFNRKLISNNLNINSDNKKRLFWFDMDYVFSQLNLNWQQNEDDNVQFKRTYERADYLIVQCRRINFNLVGCLYYDYMPDAIVILPYNLHNKYLNFRSDLISRQHIVDNVKKDLSKKKEKYNIPTFGSVIEAVNYIELNDNKIKTNDEK